VGREVRASEQRLVAPRLAMGALRRRRGGAVGTAEALDPEG